MLKNEETVYTRYFELHKEWSNSADKKDHLENLPMLVLAETIERNTDKLAIWLNHIHAKLKS